ncbi:MAG: VWA domain-containing protein [Pseudomonadales bacterium]|nr:VWA domain-containing protein [Pseudomonadales bacterium]
MMQHELSHFHFLYPLWLLALLPLGGLVIWLAYRRSRMNRWDTVIDPSLLALLRLPLEVPPHQIRSPWPWLALAWTLAVLALAGPSWQQKQVNLFKSPASLVLIMDLSPSMSAADLAPSRAVRARYGMDDLLSAIHGSRIGLIAFSDEAYTVAPLTDDANTLRHLLPALTPEIMPSAGDLLTPALTLAHKLLQGIPAQHQHIVVFTDGYSDQRSALQAVIRLKAQGIIVDVVGVGTPQGAPWHEGTSSWVTDNQGHPALTRLNEPMLQQLAQSGGGSYVRLEQLPLLFPQLLNQAAPWQNGQATQAHGHEANNGGIWLLPLLLGVVAFLARWGWL